MTPEGRQGVHPTWQCTLPHACHAKATEPNERHKDATASEGRQGVHPTPWQLTLSHACHAKAAEPRNARGTPGRTSDPLAVEIVLGTPEGRQGVQPTPWQWRLPHACHAKATEPKERQRDARVYIRPLGSWRLSHACHAKATEHDGAQGTPGGRQGVQPTPWQRRLSHACHAKATGVHPTPWQRRLSHACHAKAVEPKERQRDARAYIRPLGSGDCPTPATQKRRSPRNARGTPGRTLSLVLVGDVGSLDIHSRLT